MGVTPLEGTAQAADTLQNVPVRANFSEGNGVTLEKFEKLDDDSNFYQTSNQGEK